MEGRHLHKRECFVNEGVSKVQRQVQRWITDSDEWDRAGCMDQVAFRCGTKWCKGFQSKSFKGILTKWKYSLLYTCSLRSGEVAKDIIIKDQLCNVYAINDPKREVLFFFFCFRDEESNGHNGKVTSSISHSLHLPVDYFKPMTLNNLFSLLNLCSKELKNKKKKKRATNYRSNKL